jgi:hypothetical protein
MPRPVVIETREAREQAVGRGGYLDVKRTIGRSDEEQEPAVRRADP